MIQLQKIQQMSDNQYDNYDNYEYEQPDQQIYEEQNIQTTLQFENCQAEQLLRQKNYTQALQAFTSIYNKANQHNSRTWKAKAMQQLLQMHVQMGNGAQAKKMLHAIREMNQVDKTSQQAVKSIIKSLNSVQREIYQSFWQDIFALIKGLDDPIGQIKCYFLMFEKQLQLQNVKQSTILYQKINSLASSIPELPLASELEMSFLEILYLKLIKKPYSSTLRNLYIKIPEYEQDTNVNESYLSSIKQFIVPSLYEQQNYIQCANFMCGSFIENSKYGTNNLKNKQLLKINSLMVLLCGDLKLLEDNEFNPMLQESTATYKIQSDIQALFGLAQAFKNQDIGQFQQILKVIKLNLPANSPFADIEKRVLLQLKKQKIASICRCYKTIKFDYIKRRINEQNTQVIQQLLFSLITSNKINGIIHLEQKYLQLVPEENTYYTVQLENLKDLTQRM